MAPDSEPDAAADEPLAQAFARRGDQLAAVRLALVDALQDAHREIDQLEARTAQAEARTAQAEASVDDLHTALRRANEQNQALEAKLASTLSARVAAKLRSWRSSPS